MNIISIVGTRPQFVKMALVSKELNKYHTEKIIHTGQHYDKTMSHLFFDELNIKKPDYNLNIGSASHGTQTGKMLIEIEKVLLKEKPDLVLIYGDTNSTLSGALAASKLHIKIGHIEAGLRSFDKYMPEEINRILTDHISNLYFCPTKSSIKLLNNEGIKNNIFFTGDVMYDSVISNLKIAKNNSTILKNYKLLNKNYILVTIHRASNTNNKNNLIPILNTLLQSNEQFIFPLHPRTEKYMRNYNIYNKIKLSSNILLTKPLGYLDMIMLESSAKKIITDSGGVQKEAYFLKVPCITLRNETEWIETVKDRWNILVGNDTKKILDAIVNFNPKTKQHNYFGNGNAAKNIAEIINNL
jgi:UDP-N-acetylglucosamine 2-epimerase